MFDSFMPGARPRRLWLAIVVIGALAIVGLFVMFGVMWHRDAPTPSWHARAGRLFLLRQHPRLLAR
jgi:hypothetical protein